MARNNPFRPQTNDMQYHCARCRDCGLMRLSHKDAGHIFEDDFSWKVRPKKQEETHAELGPRGSEAAAVQDA